MPKLARNSPFSISKESFYSCAFDWPEDCSCQCGDNGMVFPKGTFEKAFSSPEIQERIIAEKAGIKTGLEYYETAFFEAFPRNPNTFIRGEGKTAKEAEENCWNQYQSYLACPGHEFEARGYENGGGFCNHCNMFMSDVIPSTHKCHRCGKPTWYTKDNRGDFWCKECYGLIPEERQTDDYKYLQWLRSEMSKTDVKTQPEPRQSAPE
jgi:hypothetical protein